MISKLSNILTTTVQIIVVLTCATVITNIATFIGVVGK